MVVENPKGSTRENRVMAVRREEEEAPVLDLRGSVLAFSTLGIQENVTGDLAFIKDEGNVLADVIAPWFATFFFAAAWI